MKKLLLNITNKLTISQSHPGCERPPFYIFKSEINPKEKIPN